MMKKHLFGAVLLGVMANSAFAESEHRSADAHEHGHGSVNMAIVGSEIELELLVPGADIIGFEYKPKTDAEKNTLKQGETKLADILSLIEMSKDANCKVTKANVEFETEEEHAAHSGEGHDHGHDDKDDHHDDAHDHDHEKKAKKKDDHHDEKHGHDHDHDHEKKASKDEKAEAEHASFHAKYKINCENPAKLTSLTFAYFKAFERAEELDVTIVTDKKQAKFEVTRDKPTIDLVGMM